VAVGTDTGAAGDLDGDPSAQAWNYADAGCTPGGAAGQAGRITAATGGSYTSGLSPADVVTTLVELIKTAVTSIGNVHLTPTGGTAEFVGSISPAGGYGPLPGDSEHVLTFELTWRGTRPCGREAQEFTGSIDVVADGVVVATKPVRVTVPGCRFHYPVAFVCGPQKAGDECLTVAPGHYATVATLYNPTSCPVVIEKRFAPVAINGDVVAREPRVAKVRPFAKIVLRPGEVTIDDCCALREAVGGFDSVIGLLDIVANGPLDVTVTTTVAGGCSSRDGHDEGEAEGDKRASCCPPAISTRSVEPRMAP